MMRTEIPVSTSLLQVREFSKRFGDYQALSRVSFDICADEILGIIGPNGAGKTTLMECVAGLLPPDEGMVLWKDHPLDLDRRKDILFYMPDDVLPYGKLSVQEVLDFFCDAFSADRGRTGGLVERLALASSLTKRVGDLSKGIRKRLLLAIGLLTSHPILFLDEPFDGLDLHQVQSVMSLLREVRNLGRTLVLSIHQLVDAERICNRFLLLDTGRLIQCGDLTQLRQHASLSSGSLEEVFLALT